MTRRGQNPYSSNSSAGFNPNSTYTPSGPSYNDPPARSPYGGSQFEERAPAAKPFKTKGMQLGAKGKKNESGLAEALGGLSVDDEPLLAHHQQRQEEQYEPQQQYQQPAAPTPTKDINPFGEVEQGE